MIMYFNSANGKDGIYDQIKTTIKIESVNQWVQFLTSSSSYDTR